MKEAYVMRQKTGNEEFYSKEKSPGFQLIDFWRWSSSDLLNNVIRGSLAEFIIARALGIDASVPRVTNDEYDLAFTHNGKGWIIEVKTSAYVQSWIHVYKGEQKISNPRFGINPTRKYDSNVGRVECCERSADIYIFCLHDEKRRECADPLNLDQWKFYPVLTSEIDKNLGDQKTVMLRTVQRLCPEGPYDFHSLQSIVIQLIEQTNAICT